MMGRTALKITLAVAMAAGLLLGVSGCGKSAEAEKQAPASKAGTEKVLRVGGEATYPLFIQRRTWTLCRIRNGSY